jgi:hypothetical protein
MRNNLDVYFGSRIGRTKLCVESGGNGNNLDSAAELFLYLYFGPSRMSRAGCETIRMRIASDYI